MSSEEQNTRTITIKRSPSKKIIKNQRHEKIDKTLAALVAIGGLIWMSATGVNYLLDQKKEIPSYQDNFRMIEQPYHLMGINEKDILSGKSILETRSYFMPLL
jgi:hypothetical protein